jgi:hypothetical protein
VTPGVDDPGRFWPAVAILGAIMVVVAMVILTW